MAAHPRAGGLTGAAGALTAASVVVMLSDHPPAIRPASPTGLGSLGVSSTTYRLHVPFGSMPAKWPSELLSARRGAGAGKASGLWNGVAS